MEKPCVSEDIPEEHRYWRIPKEYSQDEIDALNYKYLSQGWRPVASASTLGFISPDGTWFRGYDAKARAVLNFPYEKARRLGFCAPKQEEILPEEVQMPGEVV